jgi:hypothetical protein
VGKEESSATFKAVNKSGVYDPAPEHPADRSKYGCWISLCIGAIVVVAGLGLEPRPKWNPFTFVGAGVLLVGFVMGVRFLLRKNR